MMPDKLTRDREDHARNVSPVDWYIASYMLRFTELDDPKKNDLDAKFSHLGEYDSDQSRRS